MTIWLLLLLIGVAAWTPSPICMAATDGMPKFFDALPPKYDEAALKKRFKQLSMMLVL